MKRTEVIGWAIYYHDGEEVRGKTYQEAIDARRDGVQIIMVYETTGRINVSGYDYYLPFEDGTWASGNRADLDRWIAAGWDMRGIKMGLHMPLTGFERIVARAMADGCEGC